MTANEMMPAEQLKMLEELADRLEDLPDVRDLKITANTRIVEQRIEALLAALESLENLKTSLNRLLVALDE